jgi:two-component system sensor histidine kinase VanS
LQLSEVEINVALSQKIFVISESGENKYVTLKANLTHASYEKKLIENREFNQLADDVTEVIRQEFDLTNPAGNIFYTLAIETSISPVAHVINQVRDLMIPVFFFGMLISLLMAAFFARSIARPIVKLSQSSKNLSDLDLTKRIKINRRDEIGELATNLNSMAANLEAAIHDLHVTNEKLAIEMNLEKNRERQRKDFFLAVSHELKTPIMILKTQLTGMLQNIGVYKNTEKYLKRTIDTTDKMGDLVNQILKITQFNEADFNLDFVDTDISLLVEEACLVYEKLAEGRGVDLAFYCDQLIFAAVDSVQFEAALANVLSNAVVHTPAGELIDVKILRVGTVAHLRIENYGSKIDGDVNVLFEPFYRPDKSRNRYTGGSGLGLFIVKVILEKHHFEYKLENSENGVVFEVIIPLSEGG